jgi:AraC-like DNA-binding protein
MHKQPTNHPGLLERVNQIILQHLDDEHFGTGDLAREVGLSRSQLHRKLQETGGKSASQIIREFRLDQAKYMIEHKMGSISEISYMVGFGSPSYFTTCFKQFYGYSPSELKIRNSLKFSLRNRHARMRILIAVIISISIVLMIFFLLVISNFNN